MDLEGRTALVTGAARRLGIGAAIAQELARAGASVLIHYFRDYDRSQPWGVGPDEPTELATELCSAFGVEIDLVELDLAKPEAAARLMEHATSRLGHIDVLVNNAAHSENGGVESLTAEQLDRHYAVNVRSTALLCAEFARRHKPGRPGAIVNLTSGQGHQPMPDELAYAVTKGSVDALTLSLAAGLAPRGITVNAIDPGPTDTGWMTDELKEQLARESSAGRVRVPLDVATVVAFLVSDLATSVTGQIIRLWG